MDEYAVITWRDTGPLKTFASLRNAQRHNSRELELAHVEQGKPQPQHLIGSGNLVEDVRARLEEHGINPQHIRRGGIIAYEAVLSASPTFFSKGTPQEQEKRLAEWTAAQVEFVITQFGERRIVSLVLHLDELTPHMHLVVLPLQQKVDTRLAEAPPRWSLVGTVISGPGKFQELQTRYGRAMERLGLTRGRAGSGQKYRPVSEYLGELARKVAEAEEAQAIAEEATREAEGAKRRAEKECVHWRDMCVPLLEEKLAVRKAREQAEQNLAKTEADRERAKALAALLDREWDSLASIHADLEEQKAALEEQKAALDSRAADLAAGARSLLEERQFAQAARQAASDELKAAEAARLDQQANLERIRKESSNLAANRVALEREQQLLAVERNAAARYKAAVAVAAEEVQRQRVALEEEGAQIQEERESMERDQARLDLERQAIRTARGEVDAAHAAVDAVFDALARTLECAGELKDDLSKLPASNITPAVQAVIDAACGYKKAAAAVVVPAGVPVHVQARFTEMRAQLGR